MNNIWVFQSNKTLVNIDHVHYLEVVKGDVEHIHIVFQTGHHLNLSHPDDVRGFKARYFGKED